MKSMQLGPTGIEVSAVGLGAMHLSLAGRPPEAQAVALIHRALDLGVTLIDTADSYCRDEGDKHHNEHLMHRALSTWDGDAAGVVVATKGGLMRPQGRWTINGDPEHLRRTIRESHEALGGEAPIALWQHHAPDPKVGIEASLEVVREAVDERRIRFVGLSNYSVAEIERARVIVDVVSVQNQYSPWHRQPEADGVLEYCEKEGLCFLPWSPLGGSHRAKSLAEYGELTSLARERGISPQQLVLAWLRAKSPCVLPIPGTARISSLEDSLAAVEVELGGDDRERVDRALSLGPPGY